MFNNTYIYLRVILGAEHENHIIICFFFTFLPYYFWVILLDNNKFVFPVCYFIYSVQK